MKKVTVVLALFLLACAHNLSAQRTNAQDVQVAAKLSDGKNTVRVPDGKGSVQFVKRGDKFSDVVFTDAAGKTTRLAPKQTGTGNLPKPPCKFPLPDACFGTPNSGEIGMCICKPTDLSSGEEYTISLLLPAVQKVRDAAARGAQ
jgi:hypothetical protein